MERGTLIHTPRYITTLTRFVSINLLKHPFNKTTLRIEHDNAEHEGTVESHNIVVNKRTLLFYYIL